MWTRPRVLYVAAGLAMAPGVASAQHTRDLQDPISDACLRRSDVGDDNPIGPQAILPDLRRITIGAWEAAQPAVDPYTGSYVDAATAHQWRIDLVFQGLVGPMGPLNLDGGGYAPFAYASTPLAAFIEIDIDADIDTGGSTENSVWSHFLFNAGRFGAKPAGPLGERAAARSIDHDFDYTTPPYLERSGADLRLDLCGCESPTIVSEGGNGNGRFDAGETWIVEGHFLTQADGYVASSAFFNGVDFGRWNPLVRLRFSHDMQAGVTTVSLVYGLDMLGAAQLTGESVQQPDTMVNFAGSHSSIEELLLDVISAADGENFPVSGLPLLLVEGWAGRTPYAYLDPTLWDVRAIVGTAYEFEDASLYAYTDAGFGVINGDLDADGMADQSDAAIVQAEIFALDGTAADADGSQNGSLAVSSFSFAFNAHDLNYDGVVDSADVELVDGCIADVNGDGVVTSDDFFTFVLAFVAGAADLNNSGQTSSDDFFIFIAAFVSCD